MISSLYCLHEWLLCIDLNPRLCNLEIKERGGGGGVKFADGVHLGDGNNIKTRIVGDAQHY